MLLVSHSCMSVWWESNCGYTRFAPCVYSIQNLQTKFHSAIESGLKTLMMSSLTVMPFNGMFCIYVAVCVGVVLVI